MEQLNPATVPLFVKSDSKKIQKRAQLLHALAFLLEQKKDLSVPIIGGQSLLQESCTSDAYLDVTQKLLFEHNVNPNCYIMGTEPPLYIGCYNLAVQTVHALLKAKAITTRLPYCFTSPLLIICDPEQDSIIQKKVDRRIAIAKALISHGANPKETTSTGHNCFEYLATDPFKFFEITALTKEEKKLIFTQRSKLLETIKKS